MSDDIDPQDDELKDEEAELDLEDAFDEPVDPDLVEGEEDILPLEDEDDEEEPYDDVDEEGIF
jgi:hypothetical protein